MGAVCIYSRCACSEFAALRCWDRRIAQDWVMDPMSRDNSNLSPCTSFSSGSSIDTDVWMNPKHWKSDVSIECSGRPAIVD